MHPHVDRVYSLLDDESFELSDRIEEPDTKIQKNRQQSKSIFRPFWGRWCWQTGFIRFLFFYTAVPPPFFFENIFHRVKFGTFLGSGDKVHFWLVEIQKVMEI
jgi:hypothetical protein